MNTVEALKIVRERLAGGWTQHTYARDAEGYPISALSSTAESFCIYGAIDSLGYMLNVQADVGNLIASYIQAHNIALGIQSFNDHPRTTQSRVLSVLDSVIAEVSGESE